MAFDPISAAFEIGGKVIDRLWPDPAQRDAAKLELVKMQQSGELAQLTADTEIAKAQLAINQAEASSEHLFVSGWRPAIGWTCAAAYAYAFVLQPFLSFGLAASGHPIALPQIGLAELSPVLLGMLGLGGMRTMEKVKGV